MDTDEHCTAGKRRRKKAKAKAKAKAKPKQKQKQRQSQRVTVNIGTAPRRRRKKRSAASSSANYTGGARYGPIVIPVPQLAHDPAPVQAPAVVQQERALPARAAGGEVGPPENRPAGHQHVPQRNAVRQQLLMRRQPGPPRGAPPPHARPGRQPAGPPPRPAAQHPLVIEARRGAEARQAAHAASVQRNGGRASHAASVRALDHERQQAQHYTPRERATIAAMPRSRSQPPSPALLRSPAAAAGGGRARFSLSDMRSPVAAAAVAPAAPGSMERFEVRRGPVQRRNAIPVRDIAGGARQAVRVAALPSPPRAVGPAMPVAYQTRGQTARQRERDRV